MQQSRPMTMVALSRRDRSTNDRDPTTVVLASPDLTARGERQYASSIRVPVGLSRDRSVRRTVTSADGTVECGAGQDTSIPGPTPRDARPGRRSARPADPDREDLAP